MSVTYSDDAPWPGSADGGGRSLIFAGGDVGEALNWRPSQAANGNPGSSDGTPYGGDSLIDYALAGTPSLSGTLFTFSMNLGADEVSVQAQHSTDLETWLPVSSSILSQEISPDGLSRLITVEMPEGAKGYGRVLVNFR